LERVSGRLVHKPTGRTYHEKFNPPRVAGKDDLTGEPLEKRKEDEPQFFYNRMKSFHADTMPAINFYSQQ